MATLNKQDTLESQEFFELMYTYRCVPMTDQDKAVQAFRDVKDWIRENFRNPHEL